MAFIRGGWWKSHYLIRIPETGLLESVCGEFAWAAKMTDPPLADYPHGEPCACCLSGHHWESGDPVKHRLRLIAPNSPSTMWIQRNDARLLSPCHRVPVHVCHGEMKGAGTRDFEVVRVCATCGRVYDPDDCIATKTADELRGKPGLEGDTP